MQHKLRSWIWRACRSCLFEAIWKRSSFSFKPPYFLQPATWQGETFKLGSPDILVMELDLIDFPRSNLGAYEPVAPVRTARILSAAKQGATAYFLLWAWQNPSVIWQVLSGLLSHSRELKFIFWKILRLIYGTTGNQVRSRWETDWSHICAVIR